MVSNNWGSNLMFFLLVISLLLVIGILAVCFWSLLLILRQYLDLMKKMSGEKQGKTNQTESAIKMSISTPEPCQKEQGIKPFEESSGELKEKTNYNEVQKSEQSIDKHSEETREDISRKLLEFMQLTPKPDCIRLKVIDKSVISSLEEYELKEDTNGKLVVYPETCQEIIVVPESDNISEKEYEFYKIKGCYATNISIRSGYYYRVVQVSVPCIVRKRGNKYFVKSKGNLVLEQK